jgi:DMSO/TMAO reductase YedYZ molybdopterin-dependent catalytic subunit/thiosulfate reductase cytochrome b subunit
MADIENPSKGVVGDLTGGAQAPRGGRRDSFTSALNAQLTRGPDRVIRKDWAGGIPDEMATWPQLRVGRRWYSFGRTLGFLAAVGTACLGGGILLARFLRTLPAVQAFIASHPGTGVFGPAVTTGFPVWVRYQHYFNLVVMLFIMRSGLQILADHPRLTLDAGCQPDTEWLRLRGPVPSDRLGPVPPDRTWNAKDDCVGLPRGLGLPGIRHTIGLARWWHFSMDLFWVVNGVVFYALLFSTDQWHRLVPVSWEVIPSAVSVGLQYLSLDFPPPSGWAQYNALQMLAYFTTVFVAAPLALVTGLLQSPAVASKLSSGRGILNRQVARTVHFLVLLYFVAFIAVHVTMVFVTGALKNLNHITRGVDASDWGGFVLFAIGIAIVVSLWIAATPFTLRFPRVVQSVGRSLVGWMMAGMERWRPSAEYSEKDISPFFWPNGTLPVSDEYQRLKAGNFEDYRLKVGGLVEKPVEIPFADLKRMTKLEQITQHYCIQGWSGIAKWGGVSMREILELVRPKPEAKFAVFVSFAHGADPGSGRFYDAHKIANMYHPQTILAYEMNGKPLLELHGAPLRLRDELELGFKQVKWIQAIWFVESFAELGSGQGGFNEDYEYYGWRDPI